MALQITAFTDHLHTPSSRFRIRQYFSYLSSNGIHLHDYYRKYSSETAGSAKGNIRIRHSLPLIFKALIHESANIYNRLNDVIDSNKYDAVWLSRQLVIGYPTFERLIKKPLIYDIDDAIFLTGAASRLQFKITCKRASAVIAGNHFLADEAVKYCNNVYVVPTAVDTERWLPLDCKNEYEKQSFEDFRIGWSGTSASFAYLIPLQNEINKFLEDFPSSKFYIMSDRFPFELSLLNSRVNFIKWSPQSEVSFVRSLNVGIMPIKDDLWSRGKCAYKMLLYAACGIPVIVSPIGVNKEILEQANIGFGPTTIREWYDSLRELYSNIDLCKKFSVNGVKLVNDYYSVKICGPKIEHILRKFV